MTGGQGSKPQKFFTSRWFIVAGSLVFVLFFVAMGRAWYQEYLIRQEIVRLQSEARRLEAKRLKTLELLSYVKSPAYVEEKARTKLNLAKPGEQVVVINRPAISAETRQSEPPVVALPPSSNPVKWWRYIMD